MTDKIFIDSNIWLYLFRHDEANKYNIAEKFILSNADNSMYISYQVINEVTNQLVRNNFNEKMIKENIEYMYKICTVYNFSKDIIMLVSALREKYSFSFWDSMIVASSLNSGCNILASEDMQNGLVLDKMIIKNIFI